MNEPKAIIKDGKVVNHEQLKRYWRDRNRTLDRMRRGRFNDLRDRELEIKPPQEMVIVHRYSDMKKQDYDLLQQTALKADYLLKKLNEKKSVKPKSKYT